MRRRIVTILVVLTFGAANAQPIKVDDTLERLEKAVGSKLALDECEQFFWEYKICKYIPSQNERARVVVSLTYRDNSNVYSIQLTGRGGQGKLINRDWQPLVTEMIAVFSLSDSGRPDPDRRRQLTAYVDALIGQQPLPEKPWWVGVTAEPNLFGSYQFSIFRPFFLPKKPEPLSEAEEEILRRTEK